MLTVQGRRSKKLESDSKVLIDDTVTKDTPKKIEDVFDEMCPIYMAYGMTYDQYWNCNPEEYIAYREYNRICRKRRNEDAWLQGLYVFDAITTAISNIHLDNKSHKLNRYRAEPYDIFAENKTDEEKKADVKKAKQKVIDQLNSWKARWEASKGQK